MAIDTDVVTGPPWDHSRERLRWLALLRWWAMVGAMGGTVVALALGWSFVSPPGLTAGVVMGVCVNALLLWRARHVTDVGSSELTLHATCDLLLLTWLLAFSGGLTNPLSVFYSFHVVLGALLSGRRGALAATAVSAVCLTTLFALAHLGWLPTEPVDRAPQLLWLTGLALLLLGLTYFALVLAQRLREERQRAVEKQEEAVSNLRLLLGSLDALKVGLELFDEKGDVVMRNLYAETVRALPVVGDEKHGRGDGRVSAGEGVLRFAVKERDEKRIVDRLALAPDGALGLGAYLYVDRTEELLVEQRHVMLERLATLGRALQGVAHELNTPLTTMQTLAKDLEAALRELPLDDAQRRDLEESVQLIVEESRRCKGLTQGLLSTAQARSWPREGAGLRLAAVARRAVQLVGSSVDKGEVALDEASLDVPSPHDPDRVLQVLMNLVQNALRATEDTPRDGGARVRVAAVPEPGRLVIVVDDNGPGLPEEVRARLFEPFVTTRPAGEGTGLGLYVSQTIARELGGALELLDRPGGGTRARLVLPIHADEEREAPPEREGAPHRTRSTMPG